MLLLRINLDLRLAEEEPHYFHVSSFRCHVKWALTVGGAPLIVHIVDIRFIAYKERINKWEISSFGSPDEFPTGVVDVRASEICITYNEILFVYRYQAELGLALPADVDDWAFTRWRVDANASVPYLVGNQCPLTFLLDFRIVWKENDTSSIQVL